MKVVRHKITGDYIYRSEPEFKEGYGIRNAVAIYGHSPNDCEEIDITQAEWDAWMAVQAARTPQGVVKAKLAVAKSDKERLDVLTEYLGLK